MGFPSPAGCWAGPTPSVSSGPHEVAMTRYRLLAGLALGALLAVAATTPPASADEPLTVLATDVTAYPEVRMVLAVPPQLSNLSLGAPTMTVLERGESRPVRVEAL